MSEPKIVPNEIAFARTLRFGASIWTGWLLASLGEAAILVSLVRLRSAKPGVTSTAAVQPATVWWRSVLHEARFISFEISATAVGAVCIAVIFAAALLTIRHFPAGERVRRLLYFAFRVMTLWLLTTCYALSWCAYLSDGTFLDRDSLFFWLQLSHPLSLLFWTSPKLVTCLPIASLVLVLGGNWLVARIVSASSPRWRWRIATGGIVLASVFAGFGCFDNMPSRPAPKLDGELLGVVQPNSRRVWQMRRYQLGPSAAVLLDLADIGSTDDAMPVPSGDVPVVYRPLISTEDYLRGVDRSTLRRWNVVFVEVESLRPDELRIFGANRDVMPAVDQLSLDSLAFNHAYTEATHSNYAVGCPLASQYPLRSSRLYSFPAEIPYPREMIYDILKALDYHVGFFASSNDHWFGLINFLKTASVDTYQDSEAWQGKTTIFATDTGFAAWAKQTRHHGIVDDAITVKLAMDWIESQKSNPFFVYLNFQSSHFPYLTPGNFPRRFSQDRVDFDMTFDYYPVDKTAVVRGRYDDSLRYVDAQLAKLIDLLKSKSLWDHTILVLTGDHGQAFHEHGFVTHGNMLYEELVRVPLLIRVPGMAPRIDTDPVQHVDVTPMLLHLLNLPMHPGHQGVDELDPKRSRHHSIYMMVDTPLAEQYAIVQDGFKLIFDYRLQAYALYDEQKDPAESRDLLATEQTRAAKLRQRLDTWRYAQLSYYLNPLYQKESYAPFLPDP